jgi:hypothetical protein
MTEEWTEEWTKQCQANISHDVEHAPYIPDEQEICDWCLLARFGVEEDQFKVDGMRVYGYFRASQVAHAIRSRFGEEVAAA